MSSESSSICCVTPLRPGRLSGNVYVRPLAPVGFNGNMGPKYDNV